MEKRHDVYENNNKLQQRTTYGNLYSETTLQHMRI